jgi:hypothetical protein
VPIEPRVARLVDHAHAAAAELAHELPPAQPRPAAGLRRVGPRPGARAAGVLEARLPPGRVARRRRLRDAREAVGHGPAVAGRLRPRREARGGVGEGTRLQARRGRVARDGAGLGQRLRPEVRDRRRARGRRGPARAGQPPAGRRAGPGQAGGRCGPARPGLDGRGHEPGGRDELDRRRRPGRHGGAVELVRLLVRLGLLRGAPPRERLLVDGAQGVALALVQVARRDQGQDRDGGPGGEPGRAGVPRRLDLGREDVPPLDGGGDDRGLGLPPHVLPAHGTGVYGHDRPARQGPDQGSRVKTVTQSASHRGRPSSTSHT